MPRKVSIRQEAGDSLSRRLRALWSRASGAALHKSQRMYFVTLNGQRFKRLVQPDTFAASQIEATLLDFGPSERVPAFVVRYEREVWVEFIEGRVPRTPDASLARGVADLFAELYARGAREVATQETRLPATLRRNLRFLHRAGVIDTRAHAELEAAAGRLAPERVWLGFEYTDPILKNFVLAADDGRVCAVDVESLAAHALLGIGPAKAFARWAEPHRAVFLDALARPGVPDLAPSLPFAELFFLAHWMQRALLERKWHFLDTGLLERFRGAAPGVMPAR